MLIKDTSNDVQGTIVAPDGSVASRPTIMFTDDEARLLRLYRKFLEAHGLREELRCNNCFESERSDGTQAFVTSSKIGVICRCRTRLYFGSTY